MLLRPGRGGGAENTAPHLVKVLTSDEWSISHFGNIIARESPIDLLGWKMCDIVIQYGHFGEYESPLPFSGFEAPHSAGVCTVTWAIPAPSCMYLRDEVLHVAGTYFYSISTRVYKYYVCKYTGLFVHWRKRKLLLTWKSVFFLPAYESVILLSITENISTFWVQIDKKK
jgi:hypothetical protein